MLDGERYVGQGAGGEDVVAGEGGVGAAARPWS